ncbi:MAG: hypothetical protein QOJ86_912 [Bradyrhizobium sp.]|jgi:hypothetical protein|nr:hypothetical protein [Bradyrhizobium sp.]
MRLKISAEYISCAVGLAGAGMLEIVPDKHIFGWFLLGLAFFIFIAGVRIDGWTVKFGRPREQRRKLNTWGPWILIVAGPVIGLIWLYLAKTGHLGATDRTQVATSHGLLRKYPSDVDKEALRTIFRDISTLVNDEVSPAQLEVHKLLDMIPQKIGEPAAEAGIKRFAEIRVQFEKIRNGLYAKYVTGKYHADEAWDILQNTDALYGEINALDQYVELGRVVQSGDSGKLVRALVEPRKALEKTNGDLGNWVGECLKRIQTKRDALDG